MLFEIQLSTQKKPMIYMKLKTFSLFVWMLPIELLNKSPNKRFTARVPCVTAKK